MVRGMWLSPRQKRCSKKGERNACTNRSRMWVGATVCRLASQPHRKPILLPDDQFGKRSPYVLFIAWPAFFSGQAGRTSATWVASRTDRPTRGMGATRLTANARPYLSSDRESLAHVCRGERLPTLHLVPLLLCLYLLDRA